MSHRHVCIGTANDKVRLNLRCAMCVAAWVRTAAAACFLTALAIGLAIYVAHTQGMPINHGVYSLITTTLVLGVTLASTLLPLNVIIEDYKIEQRELAYALSDEMRAMRQKIARRRQQAGVSQAHAERTWVATLA